MGSVQAVEMEPVRERKIVITVPMIVGSVLQNVEMENVN